MAAIASPVVLGEHLLAALRIANLRPEVRVCGQNGTYGHIRNALLDLMGSQGWGPNQAAEAIMQAQLDGSTLAEAMTACQVGAETPKGVTREQAEQAFTAILTQFGTTTADTYGPELKDEWWCGDRQWTILWEEGPWHWTSVLPEGGQLDDMVDPVPATELPEGVRIEAINHYSVAVYPA